MRIVPVTLRDACAFIAQHHRHNKPPVGWKFGCALMDGDRMIGVATAGRPVARHYDDGLTIEVNRTCTDGTKNANSMLYGAIRRAAKALGYVRGITYTQADESGTSLLAAGWKREKELAARPSWAESSVKLRSKRDAVGNGGVARVLWTTILLAGCAAEPPKQIVRTETVQVPVEVRIPIPQEYVQDCVVTPQIPGAVWYITMDDGTKQQMQACFINGKPALCNGQAAIEHDDYRAALRKCNADKQALRALK